MMHLIHDNEVVKVSPDLFPQSPSSEHVYRTEEMVKASCDMRAHQKLAEIWNTKHGPKCAGGLFENLFPMSNEQKTCLPLLGFEEPLEVKCRDNRFPRSSRRDYKITPVSVDEAFGFQSIENSFLKGMRTNVEKNRRNSLPGPRMF